MLIKFSAFLKEDDYEDSFTHEDNLYSLTKLKTLAADIQVKSIAVSELTWIFEYDDPNEDHPERIVTANLEQPILIIKDQGQWVVLDGLHRLAKASRRKIKELPAKIIPDDMLKKCLLEPEDT